MEARKKKEKEKEEHDLLEAAIRLAEQEAAERAGKKAGGEAAEERKCGEAQPKARGIAAAQVEKAATAGAAKGRDLAQKLADEAKREGEDGGDPPTGQATPWTSSRPCPRRCRTRS